MFPCQVSVSRLKPQLWQPLKSLELLWGRVLPKMIALTSFKCWIILSLRLVFTFSQSSGHWWHFVEEPADIDWRGTSFQLGFYFPLSVNPVKGRCRKYIWAYYIYGGMLHDDDDDDDDDDGQHAGHLLRKLPPFWSHFSLPMDQTIWRGHHHHRTKKIRETGWKFHPKKDTAAISSHQKWWWKLHSQVVWSEGAKHDARYGRRRICCNPALRDSDNRWLILTSIKLDQ